MAPQLGPRLALAVGFAATLAFVPAPLPWSSLTSRVLASYAPESPTSFEPARAAAVAQAFLDSLDGAQRSAALHAIDSAERANWTNVPPGADEEGVRLGDLSEQQLALACDLLASVLSPQGYAQTRDILLADDLLLRNGTPRVGFGAENFWLVFFGTPSAREPWALQVDGHHLAWNLSFHGDVLEMSPSFIGTQPARYSRGGTTVEPMAAEVDAAFALLASLSDEQRSLAIVAPTRQGMLAGPGRDGVRPEAAGVSAATFDAQQRSALGKLLAAYVGDLPEPQASARMRELTAEIDAMHFAWYGPAEGPADVSYRLQGPSLIVEYACQNLGGNPLDHLHSIYRDPTNEYGAGQDK